MRFKNVHVVLTVMLDVRDVPIQFANVRYVTILYIIYSELIQIISYIPYDKALIIISQDVTKNENWNSCLDMKGKSLARCIYDCKDDAACETDCVGQFKVQTDDCPCEV